MIATPRTMNISPGIIIHNPDLGFSIIPLHVSAIGHIGIGVDPAIALSVYIENLSQFLRGLFLYRGLSEKLAGFFADRILSTTIHH